MSDAQKWMESMRADVQRGPGALPADVRARIFEYASARAAGRAASAGGLDEDVRRFVDAVVMNAVSADVAALKAAGKTEDAIYELACTASVAAGTERGVLGLAALRARRGGR
jgi:hypothetical protein